MKIRTDSGRFTLEGTLPACFNGEVKNMHFPSGINLFAMPDLKKSLITVWYIYYSIRF